MNEHTANEVKGNKQPHVRLRTARAMNSFLQDALEAQSGSFDDCPELRQHYIDCYIIFLEKFHRNGEAGSLLN